MEEIAEGERVREFRLIAETSEGEHELYHAQTIGHKRLIRLDHCGQRRFVWIFSKALGSQESGTLKYSVKREKGEIYEKEKTGSSGSGEETVV